MNAPATKRDKLTQMLALLWLLAIGLLALAGPYGVLAWGEQVRLLDVRQDRIAGLQAERQVLQNHNNLLDPDNVDPDFSSELVRSNLNVAHPDDYVIDLDQQP